VAFVRTEVSEELISSITRLKIIGEQITVLPVTGNTVTSSLILSNRTIEAIHYSETSVLTSTAQHHIPEDGILQLIHVLLTGARGNFCAQSSLVKRKPAVRLPRLANYFTTLQTVREYSNPRPLKYEGGVVRRSHLSSRG
jgi:hypothetical protein